jgi:hypothetical protein
MSPVGLVNIFHSLRFETSLFVASYNLQGGIRPRLHTGNNWLSQLGRVMQPRSGPIENTTSNSNFNAEIMNVPQELKVVACWEVLTSSKWVLVSFRLGTSFEIFLCQVWFARSLWLDVVSLSVFKKSFPVLGSTLLGILLRLAVVCASRLSGEVAVLHQSYQEISSLFMWKSTEVSSYVWLSAVVTGRQQVIYVMGSLGQSNV